MALATGAGEEQNGAAIEQLDAREAVHHGNQLLINGDAPTALEAYNRAEDLRPEASEIPFVKGLGYYALKQYDKARDAFERAALSKNRALADDATYSVGTTYHAEALENTADPQAAIEKIENAMQRYQQVLASEPQHVEARDSIVKAASMRRRLKQMLEQQQQKQEQNQDQDQQNDEEQKEDQQPQDGQGENDQDKQQQGESQQDQSDDKAQDQQSDQTGRQQEDESRETESLQNEQKQEEEPEQGQESEAQQQEQTSHEQARRRLREMMQNIRERQKHRRPQPEPLSVPPVDKDW